MFHIRPVPAICTALTLAALACLGARHALDRQHPAQPPAAPPVRPGSLRGQLADSRTTPGERVAAAKRQLHAALKQGTPIARRGSLIELFSGLASEDFPAIMEEMEATGWDACDSAPQMGLKAWLDLDAAAACNWATAHGRQIHGAGDLDQARVLEWAVKNSGTGAGPDAHTLAEALKGTLKQDPQKVTAALATLAPEERKKILEDSAVRYIAIDRSTADRWLDSIADTGLRAEAVRYLLCRGSFFFDGTAGDYLQKYPEAFDRASMEQIADAWLSSSSFTFFSSALQAEDHPWHQAIMSSAVRKMTGKRQYDEARKLLMQYPDFVDRPMAANLARSALTGNPAAFLDSMMEMPEGSVRDLVTEETLAFWSSVTGPERPERWMSSRQNPGGIPEQPGSGGQGTGR